ITVQPMDLFAAPENSILMHACNCQGDWGGGIALAFKKIYPNAYQFQRDYCLRFVSAKTSQQLVGTALLIPPMDSGNKHFIGCLFTSHRYGRAKDSPEKILESTKPAVEAMFTVINKWNERHEPEEQCQYMYMCKINSGLFNVPWESTQEIIEELDMEL
ncbi:hypothetical protein BT63DRAFT_362830, partial [Microthyrium microscopicum]